jgi:hypothetical protein
MQTENPSSNAGRGGFFVIFGYSSEYGMKISVIRSLSLCFRAISSNMKGMVVRAQGEWEWLHRTL